MKSMNSDKKDLELLCKEQQRLMVLRGIDALLGWDEQTGMPEKGAHARAQHKQFIGEEIHKLMHSEQLLKAVNRLKKTKLQKKDSIVIRELYKDLQKIRKVPNKLNNEINYHTVIAGDAWRKARAKNDYSIFLPELKKMVELRKKYAKAIDPKKKSYDVLLDDHEEGMTTQRLTEIFGELKPRLAALLERIKNSPEYAKKKLQMPKVSDERQELASRRVLRAMQLPRERSHFSKSPHPFTTTISYDDVRITTRYSSIIESFHATMHEAGHALYELGLPQNYKDTVVCNAPSMGLHESQSIVWEIIGQSKEFWTGFYTKFRQDTGIKYSLEEWYRINNDVRPSYIRVSADELTYGLHIILRFEIERDMINGKLKIEDSETEWNKRFKELFGIEIKKDSDGILQDIHWSFGEFGYFPSYLLGRIYASQLYEKMLTDIPGAKEKLRKTDLEPFIQWLGKNIHSKGRTMLADETIKKATGKGLDIDTFMQYLEEKYKRIYSI